MVSSAGLFWIRFFSLLCVVYAVNGQTGGAAAEGGKVQNDDGGAALPNPRIVEHPEDHYVARNEPATLNCKAEGEPTPLISWYKDGEPVTTATELPTSHRMLLPSGQLFFLRIMNNKNNKQDVGVYYCNATSPVTGKSAISRNATISIASIASEFREQPSHLEVNVGTDATLQCTPPRGEPEPQVRWLKDGEVVKVGDRLVLLDSGSLKIRGSQREDAGQYVCVGFNVAGKRESLPARFTVREKPRITEGPKDAVVQENADVTFNCHATGNPEPTIIWKKADDQMPQGRLQIHEDRSLKIERTRTSDEGVYICRAENSIGWQEAEAKLVVHSQPSFLLTPRDKVVGVGRRAVFRCEVTGNPTPAVFWNKESSQTLMFPNQDNGRMSVSEDGTLVIDRVELEDAGEYVCKGLSIAGSAYAKARLEVKDIDARPAPIIYQIPQNQTLPINSVAMLQCAASGDPSPTIRWLRDGRGLPARDPRFTVLDSGTLQISDLRKSDSGVYTCKAMSETGETSWSASLVVETPSNPSVVFHRTPEPSTFPGAPTRPIVSDVTDSSVRLTWKGNRNQGSSPVVAYTAEYFSHETGEGWVVASDRIVEESYIVKGLRQDTAYMFLVRAQNSHGLSLPSHVTAPIRTKGASSQWSTNMNLDLDVVSDRLSGNIVTTYPAEALGSTSVKVSWEVRRNHKYIEGFHIHYCASKPQPSGAETTAGRRPKREILVPNYIGALGENEKIVDTKLRMETKYGDSFEKLVDAMGAELDMLNSSHTGIEGLVRKGRLRRSRDGFMVETVQGADTTMYTLTQLEEDTWYDISVQPFYKTVTGLESNVVRVKTLEDSPSATPQNIRARMIDNTTLYLSWEAPPPEHHNGLLKGYKIYIFGNESKFYREIEVNASLTAIYVHQMSPEMIYKIQIAAFNRMGDGIRTMPYELGPRTSSLRQSIAREPWFIATLIGSIGGVLWILLCIISVWLYQKRRNNKKMGSKIDYSVKPCPDIPRQNGISSISQQYQPKPHNTFLTLPPIIDFSAEILSLLNSFNPNYALEATFSSDMLYQYASDAGPMGRLGGLIDMSYDRQNSSYGTGAGSDSVFLPIHQAYMIQHPTDSDACIKRDISATGDLHSVNQSLNSSNWTPNQPVLFLPPPPEHPPPSEMGTPPDSPLLGGQSAAHLYHSADDDRGLYGGMDGRDPHYNTTYCSLNPRIYQNDAGIRTFVPPAMNRASHSNSGSGSPRSNTPRSAAADHRRVGELRGEPPGGIFGVRESCSPATMGAGRREERYNGARDYRDDHNMSLPANQDLGGWVYSQVKSPESVISSTMNHSNYNDLESDVELSMLRPDEYDSINEESVCTDEDANLAECAEGGWVEGGESDCSTVNSLSEEEGGEEEAFLAEADFASAVARAAQLSGLTVIGSTVSNPNAAANVRDNKPKRPVRQRQRARPQSPYSTDSNYSEVPPHRPYPKSDRRRQMRTNGGAGPRGEVPGSRGEGASRQRLLDKSAQRSDIGDEEAQSIRMESPPQRLDYSSPLTAFNIRNTPIV